MSKQKEENILCFGDSLTEGLCDKVNWKMQPYTTKFQELVGDRFVVENYGVSGAETVTMIDTIDFHLQNKNYSFIFILGGTNDLATLTMEKITSNLLQIHKKALNAGATTFALSIPEMKYGGTLFEEEKRNAVNENLKNFAQETPNCYFLSWDTEIRNNNANYKFWSDNIHLSEDGYSKMGQVIFDLCKSIIMQFPQN